MPDPDVELVAQAIMQTLPVFGRALASRIRCAHEGALPGHLVLLHAVMANPMALGELAELLQVSPATMSATVNTLVQRGWLSRERSTTDRRIVWVGTTPAGVEVLRDIDRQARALLIAMLSPLPAGDLDVLSHGMDVLRRVVENALTSPCPYPEGAPFRAE